MEQKQKFQLKLNTYKKAIFSFSNSLNIDINSYNDIVKDAVKNGRIQKFEYTTELAWKLIKKYLYVYHNIDAKSPNQSIKEFFIIGLISQNSYEKILEMIEMRNRLSHEYREDYFEEIHNQLNNSLELMNEISEVITIDINS
jgi:nucleotidyltransferase substrate binding protein (TIGR01987 family)